MPLSVLSSVCLIRSTCLEPAVRRVECGKLVILANSSYSDTLCLEHFQRLSDVQDALYTSTHYCHGRSSKLSQICTNIECYLHVRRLSLAATHIHMLTLFSSSVHSSNASSNKDRNTSCSGQNHGASNSSCASFILVLKMARSASNR